MKEQILKLRSEGKSYREIQLLLKCSKGTIAFHCGVGQKLKYYTNRKKTRERHRIKIKQDFGGKCIQCGYNKCISALEFHHLNFDKDMGVSDLLFHRSYKMAYEEAKKCILLCANCHREIHDKILNKELAALMI